MFSVKESTMFKTALEIANAALIQNQWRVYAVGGFVRDMVLGIYSKDLDLEVFGPRSVDELIKFLEQFGEVNAVGKSFGVLKLKVNGIDLDVSLPRTESKRGKGHKGFVVKSDGDLLPMEASKRRDFTFNALMFDFIDNKIIDFFNGESDLIWGKLRSTSSQFSDDPLRVLRGMQFCGRFNLTADNTTVKLCRSLLTEFDTLAKERIWVEFEKWAAKSVKPSRGLVFLLRCGWLKMFPELYALVGVKQSPDYHAEGSVWQHTKMVVDQASKIAERENLSKEDRLILVLAALLHDVGKPLVTGDDLKAPKHDKAGEEIARRFLESIDAPNKIKDAVCSLVKHHMSYATTRSGVRRVSNRLVVPLSLLLLLFEADTKGRISTNPNRKQKTFDKIKKIARLAEMLNVKDDKPQPILMGRHLINAGMKPGKEFGVILSEAFQLQLDGEIQQLEGALEWLAQRTN